MEDKGGRYNRRGHVQLLSGRSLLGREPFGNKLLVATVQNSVKRSAKTENGKRTHPKLRTESKTSSTLPLSITKVVRASKSMGS